MQWGAERSLRPWRDGSLAESSTTSISLTALSVRSAPRVRRAHATQHSRGCTPCLHPPSRAPKIAIPAADRPAVVTRPSCDPSKPQPGPRLPAPPMCSVPLAYYTCAVQAARGLHSPDLASPAQRAVAHATPTSPCSAAPPSSAQPWPLALPSPPVTHEYTTHAVLHCTTPHSYSLRALGLGPAFGHDDLHRLAFGHYDLHRLAL